MVIRPVQGESDVHGDIPPVFPDDLAAVLVLVYVGTVDVEEALMGVYNDEAGGVLVYVGAVEYEEVLMEVYDDEAGGVLV